MPEGTPAGPSSLRTAPGHGEAAPAVCATATPCRSGLCSRRAVEGLDNGVEQGQQHRLDRLTVRRVTRYDRHLGPEVEHVADPRLLGLVHTLGTVQADDKRYVRHLAEGLED